MINKTVKAIIVLVAIATSACNTKQQTMAIYANAGQFTQQQAMQQQVTAQQAKQSEMFIQDTIRADSTASLGCDPKFANCNIITGAN
jgi:hypothetical protein